METSVKQNTLNIYGDLIIKITNQIMGYFLDSKYIEYLNKTDFEKLKQSTNQLIMIYLITLQEQPQTPSNMQSLIRNTTCENILNIWFQKNSLNITINDELLYNVLYIKLDNYLKQF
jgi:hypothetical protein